MNKVVKVKNSANKVIEYKNQSNVLTKLLVKALENENVDFDLAHIVKFCLTPTPYNIGTADNYLAKTDKATSFNNITKDIENACH